MADTEKPAEQTAPAAETAAPESPAASTPPNKRKGPGRPSNAERAAVGAAPVSPSAESAKPKGKPGPKPGKSKSKVSYDGESLAALTKQVQGLHHLMALATGIPELQLAEPEAQMLGSAIAQVCEEYDFSLSGKTGAMLQLAAAAAMVYAPRFAAVTQRVKQQQAAARARQAELRVVGGTDGAGSPVA